MTDDVQVPIEYQMIPVDLLENNHWNPNSMEQADFDRLIDEIKDVGFLDPVAVVMLDSGRYRIIGGEHRSAAARELKMEEIPAVVLQGSRFDAVELQKLLTVRFNSLSGKVNPEKMALLYKEMAKKYGEDSLRDLFAFSDKHGWKKLVSQIKKGLSNVSLPKETREKLDQDMKEAKTLQDLEKILNDMWSSYGDTVHQSFMIFTYGRREHIYVRMAKDTRKAVKDIVAHCKKTGEDINEVLAPALQALGEVVSKKDAKKVEEGEGELTTPTGVDREDDVPF